MRRRAEPGRKAGGRCCADLPRALLIGHCDLDGIVPLEEARRAYAHAGEPKELQVLPDARHHDVYYSPWRERVMGAAAAWYERYLGRG